MHEMGTVLNIARTCNRLAKQYNVDKLSYVSIELGEVSDALPKYLQLLWPDGTKGTVCEGSELRINVIKAIAHCQNCGEEYPLLEHLKDNLPCCPKCSSDRFSFKQGSGMMITELGVPE